MKGISAVIATILLLLIAIAIIGFAFGFFQRIFTGSSAAVENQTSQITGQSGQVLRIDNVQGTSLTLRHIGTVPVATASVAFYINNVATTCNFGALTSIAPGSIATCTLATGCTAGQQLRVSTPGFSDTRTC